MATTPKRRSTRTPRKRKPQRGGAREGAGRKALIQGERVKVGVKMTVDTMALVAAERQRLVGELGEQASLATEAAAMESLIRRGAAAPIAGAKRRRGK